MPYINVVNHELVEFPGQKDLQAQRSAETFKKEKLSKAPGIKTATQPI